MVSRSLPRIVATIGDPAGIGPDIVLGALCGQHAFAAAIGVVGDPGVLSSRAELLGVDAEILAADSVAALEAHRPGRILVLPVSVARPVVPGRLDSENARSVVRCIDIATDSCMESSADAMVTAPVNKAMINAGGIRFRGHTEWIAERTGGDLPVMMLASPSLRVCLATTHLPLSEVPAAFTRDRLERILRIMHHDIGRLHGIPSPEIGVLGLNPHAGEDGYLGREEIDTITPVIRNLRNEGLRLVGPLPADTAFTKSQLARFDAILAMYHDQGLPVVKHQGFGQVVNVTLGLPIIRTSVDHGTALDLAGTGDADPSSMVNALNLAVTYAKNRLTGDA